VLTGIHANPSIINKLQNECAGEKK